LIRNNLEVVNLQFPSLLLYALAGDLSFFWAISKFDEVSMKFGKNFPNKVKFSLEENSLSNMLSFKLLIFMAEGSIKNAGRIVESGEIISIDYAGEFEDGMVFSTSAIEISAEMENHNKILNYLQMANVSEKNFIVDFNQELVNKILPSKIKISPAEA
jgi:hypothetical protein